MSRRARRKKGAWARNLWEKEKDFRVSSLSSAAEQRRLFAITLRVEELKLSTSTADSETIVWFTACLATEVLCKQEGFIGTEARRKC